MTNQFRLEMTGITKRYKSLIALDDASLRVEPGEVMCLLGENGAGKSTLIKVLTGSIQADSGRIILNGQPIQIEVPSDATKQRISVVHQELDLLPDLSVEQNLFVGREPSHFGVVSRRSRSIQARVVLDRLGAKFSPKSKIRELSVVQRQLVSIARALTIDSQVLVMDEPSATLTAEELTSVFNVIRSVTQDGLSVIYISHRLDEVFEIGDRATVMRDGRTVGVHDLSNSSQNLLISEMIGRETVDAIIDRQTAEILGPGLSVTRVYVPKLLDIRGVHVPRGQITGIIGLGGSGRTTFLSSLFGSQPSTMDAVLDGRTYAPKHPAQAIDMKVGLVPEDRKSQGLSINQSIWLNLTAASNRHGFLRRWPNSFKRPHEFIKSLGIRISSVQQKAGELSGGNQQKVVLAKWLVDDSNLLLLDEPTRGLDVRAKADLFNQVRELTKSGCAALVATSEMSEVISYCDSVYVLYEGKKIGHFTPDHDNKHKILEIMISGKEHNEE